MYEVGGHRARIYTPPSNEVFMSYKNHKEYIRAVNKWLNEEPETPRCMLGDSEVARIDSSGELTIEGIEPITLTREEARALAVFLNQMYGDEDERNSEAV